MAKGERTFTTSELGLLAGALSATYADIKSTKDLIKRGGKETNPLLGENPSDSDLNRAGLLASLAGTSGALMLPGKYRAGALGAWAGTEAALAYKNRKAKGAGGKPESFSEGWTKPALIGLASGILAHKFLGRDDDSGVSVKDNMLTFSRKF